ncbi:MAG TPA: geranylgeranyl reductase family protein [Planctomycetota bacterium]|nr:geranylgeranyl reductase family protein [Planctomycetota bacterium]
MIGGGPAGATAAADLARGGVEVVLFHADPARGEKPCGGGVTLKAYRDRPELRDLDVGATDVRRVCFVSPRGRRVVVETEREPFFSLCSRARLDAALRARAQAAGAHIVEGRVADVHLEAGGAVIVGAAGTERFDLAIGADGAFSMLRRRLFGPPPREYLCPAIDAVVTGIDPADGVTLAFYSGVTGYLWAFPRHDGASVGIVAREGELAGDAMRERIRDFLASRHPEATIRRSQGWVIPAPDERGELSSPIAGPGWLLVGDAAGIADPITGEGIYHAIRTGALAAEACLVGDPASYPERVARDLQSELAFSGRWARRYFRARYVEAVLLAARFSKGVREILADLMSGRERYAGLERRIRSQLGLLGWLLMQL